MYAAGTKIKAQNVEPGMVVDIYGDERVAIEKVKIEYGAVQVHDHVKWYGLSANEQVTVQGYFNPEE